MAKAPTSAEDLLRRYAEGERDFSRAQLPGAKLGHVSLVGVDLTGAELSGADLRRTELERACLRGANLKGAAISSASLGQAILSQVNLAGANLVESNLSQVDLRSAEISSADIRGANLARANLSASNLSDSRLGESNLADTNLGGANLHRADLSWANLRGANLREANLREANLREANLTAARLRLADLTKARLGWTTLASLNLAATKGLDATEHLGPSNVDGHTLSRQGWTLPEEFLRGCGLQDWEIEAAKLHNPSLTPAETAEITNRLHELRHKDGVLFYSVFISYSHADIEFARRLERGLQSRGIRCWFDEKQLLPGDKIRQEIKDGILRWDKVLLCASESSLKSWWVKNEIEIAFEKERRLSKEKGGASALALIPLNLDDALFRWEDGYQAEVASRLAADFRRWASPHFDFDGALERVIAALRADGWREAVSLRSGPASFLPRPVERDRQA